MPLGSRRIGVVVTLLTAAVVAGAGVRGFKSDGVTERPRRAPPLSQAGVLPATDGARTPARCPAPPGETVEPGYRGSDSGPALGNRDVVEAYSKGHPGEFGGYQFAAGQPEKLRVAFTDHVAEHAGALRALVPIPERLDVVRGVHTVGELADIRERLSGELARPDRSGVFTSLSVGWQAVDIGMNPGLEDLAARYAERFGSGVRITLGGHAYVPAGCGPQVDHPRCPDLVGADPATSNLLVAIVSDTPTISAAQTGKARLVVHNLGSRRFVLDSGVPVVGKLLLPGTASVVGSWVGNLAGVGGGVDLKAGERGEIAVLYGASRCDGQPGSALPPGRYELRAVLAPERGGEPRFISRAAMVTIVENPPQPA